MLPVSSRPPPLLFINPIEPVLKRSAAPEAMLSKQSDDIRTGHHKDGVTVFNKLFVSLLADA